MLRGLVSNLSLLRPLVFRREECKLRPYTLVYFNMWLDVLRKLGPQNTLVASSALVPRSIFVGSVSVSVFSRRLVFSEFLRCVNNRKLFLIVRPFEKSTCLHLTRVCVRAPSSLFPKCWNLTERASSQVGRCVWFVWLKFTAL